MASATTGTGNANAYASAVGGRGTVDGGNAAATAIGTGAGGTVSADAQTQVLAAHPTTAILAAETKSSGTVSTSAISQANLKYGASLAFVTSPQAVANADLAPAASSSAVTSVLGSNTAIAAAFTGAKQFYAVGELGGGHGTGGTASQTSTAQLYLTIDQTKVPSGGHLVVGLYGGTLVGSGITGVSLSVTENGTAVAPLSFTNDTAVQARAAFTNMGFDLGTLSGTGTVSLGFTLSVTSTSAGSGFYGGVIVGDPPGHAAAVMPHSHWTM
jgi:hypothetical protein